MSEKEQIAIDRLERQVNSLRVALVTTLIWMSGSANSPLRHEEVERLIAMAEANGGRSP